MPRVMRQRKRFLQRRIPSANDDHVLSLKQRSVAVSTLRNALPFELGFTRNAEPLDLRARCHDHRPSGNLFSLA